MVVVERSAACSIRSLRLCSGFSRLLRRFAERCRREVAGFLLGRVEEGMAVVESVVVGCNVAEAPAAEFVVDAQSTYEAVKVAESSGLSIIGVFHTHVGCPAGLSEKDRAGMDAWPVVWLVAGADGLKAYSPCRSVDVVIGEYECTVRLPLGCRLCE